MFIFFNFLKLIYLFYFTTLYWFCHTLTWIRHGCTCVPHPEPCPILPPHPIPLGHPSAPTLSILYHALNLDWWFVSHMIIYMFQCHSLISSHPCPLPQSPKDCSIHLCLSCCFAPRVIVTIFLNPIYMHFHPHSYLMCSVLLAPRETPPHLARFSSNIFSTIWLSLSPYTKLGALSNPRTPLSLKLLVHELFFLPLQ